MNTSTKNKFFNPGLTLVVGGTGKTGRRVAEKLTQKGVAVRIGSRSAQPGFDWNDPNTWSGALEGVKAAYITYAPDLAIPGATDAIRNFTTRAVAQGVERLVLLSGRGEKEAQDCERIVQQSGVDWTIVRSSWFAQNFSEGEFLGMVLDGAITLPAGDVPEPFIDINDIADVVVAGLTQDGHAGEVYEVTGPSLLTFEEAAQEISRATGRDIPFIELTREEFMAGIDQSGMPADIAWLLNYLFETVLDGRNAYVSDGVQRALGRPPVAFAEFAERIAARGTWNEVGPQAISAAAGH